MDGSTVSSGDPGHGTPPTEAAITNKNGNSQPCIGEPRESAQHRARGHGLIGRMKRKLDPRGHSFPPESHGTVVTTAELNGIFGYGPKSGRLDGRVLQQPDSTAKKLVHEPIQTIKSSIQGQVAQKIAGNIAAAEIPHEHDVKIIEAQDTLLQANTTKEELEATERRDELLKAREAELVRWTLNRHVTRIKALSDSSVTCQPRGNFQIINEQGQSRTDWVSYFTHLLQIFALRRGSRYIDYGLFPPPVSQAVIAAIIERLLVVSSPLQQSAMQIRAVYRWEDPTKTTVYLVAFVYLWSLDLLLPASILAGIVLVLLRAGSSPTIEDLRHTIQHVENMSKHSDNFVEFVEKNSSASWLEPLVDAVGDWVLVQLGDLASLIEILQNFYAWRSSYYTAMALFKLILILAIISATSTRVLVKCTTLWMGFVFFALFPISSRYPRYRLLLSPKTLLFWKIPTHAEWAISTLVSQRAMNNKIQAREGPVPEFGRYACMHDNHKGHLILDEDGARFETTLLSNTHWMLPYKSILRIEKLPDAVALTDSDGDIEITSADQKAFTLHKVSGRAEAFNQIIAAKGCRWMPEW